MSIKANRLRILALVICFLTFLSGFSGYAVNGDTDSGSEKSIKVVFSGNAQTPNLTKKGYGELISRYLEERLGTEVENVVVPSLNLGSESFLNDIEENILSESPDAVFLEFNVSQKVVHEDKELKNRLGAIVQKLEEKDKKTAVYFIYSTDKNFNDYRASYDYVADYYGINVIDFYSYFKRRYVSGNLDVSRVLTAGEYIGEGGHKLLADYAEACLKGVSDILALPDYKKKPLGDIEKYYFEKIEKEQDEKTNAPAEFYVSKTGSDSASGSINAPFATIERARDAIKSLKKKQKDSFAGATVYIREGNYRIASSIVFSKEDSGEEGAPIVYMAYPGEEVRFTNASTLDPKKWQKVTNSDMLSRIPEAARDKVLVYDLIGDNITPGASYRTGNVGWSARSSPLNSVFVVNDRTEPRAAYPNGGFSRVAEGQSSNKKEIYYIEDKGDTWKTADNAWIKGTLSSAQYFTDYVQVDGFDFDKKIIKLKYDTAYGSVAGGSWSIFNLIEEMDMPSEWWLDDKTGMLYYYPRGDLSNYEILYSGNSKPMFAFNEAKHITLRGLKMTACGGTAVEINDGYSNKIEDCEIGNAGHRGVQINHTENKIGPGNNGITGCHIYNTAVSGVTIEGGDRKTLTPQNDYVENCHLENFAYEAHSETAALETRKTVGVTFKNNTIHNDDSCALFMGGNDDQFLYNEMYNIGRETDDYGVIYGDANGAITQGVTVKNNYFHHCLIRSLSHTYGQLSLFYADAMRNNGAKVDNNVFVETANPIFIATNQNMAVRGNLIIDAESYGIKGYYSHVSTSKIEGIHEQIKQEAEDGTVWTKYKSEGQMPDKLIWRSIIGTGRSFTEEQWKAYYRKYPWSEHYLEDGPLTLRDVIVKDNAVFNTGRRGIDLPQESADSIDSTENYVTDETVPIPESGSFYERVDNAMEIAAEKLPGFEKWDVREAGCDLNNVSVGSFSALYPLKNQTDVDVETLSLCWDFAPGADEYQLVIATDPEFKDIVYEENTTSNWSKPTGIEYGVRKYYWKVKAVPYSERFVGTPENDNGVMCFTTKRSGKVDKEGLWDAIEQANALMDEIVEGENPGDYMPGTKAIIEMNRDIALKAYNNIRATNVTCEEAKTELLKVITGANGMRVLSETNLADVFNSPENILICKDSATPVPGQDENGKVLAGVKADEKGITFKGKGAAFANRDFDVHEIIHFKGKFDFSGVSSPSNYVLFSIKAQGYSEVLHDVTNYCFLVTKDNIELQAFKKPTNEGKMYLTVPNTYIEEGKEYDIEFGAIPVDEGKNVRLLFVVNGEVVYDVIDDKNIINSGGKVGFVNSSDNAGLTIMQPDKDLPYPSLLERVTDPDSELYKK